MKLLELIKTNNWLSVQYMLLNLYPDQEDNLISYQSIYIQLQQSSASKTNMQIVLTQYFDEETNEKSYVDVSGLKKSNDQDTVMESYAIEFVPWKEWLGMTINKDTLAEFNELEIISHCLYEMTFVGYNEEEIQEQFSAINDSMEEYKNMTEEEKKMNTKSLDDLLKEGDEV